MNEQALFTIISCLDGYADPPHLNWPQDKIEHDIFSKWATEEILNLVWDHPYTPASVTIEEFALKMKAYAANAVTGAQRRIFSIAAETAYELLDWIAETEQ